MEQVLEWSAGGLLALMEGWWGSMGSSDTRSALPSRSLRCYKHSPAPSNSCMVRGSAAGMPKGFYEYAVQHVLFNLSGLKSNYQSCQQGEISALNPPKAFCFLSERRQILLQTSKEQTSKELTFLLKDCQELVTDSLWKLYSATELQPPGSRD